MTTNESSLQVTKINVQDTSTIMPSLDTVLASSSLAAEAVLRSGINLKTAEIPDTLKKNLLLLTEGAVGSWGLLGYNESMQTLPSNKVPRESQWDLLLQAAVRLPTLEISRTGSISWLLQTSQNYNFVPIACSRAGYSNTRLPLSLNSVKHTTIDREPVRQGLREEEDAVQTLVWLEDSSLRVREQLTSSEYPSEDFHWQMALRFTDTSQGLRLNLELNTQLGNLPVYSYHGRYAKL